MGKIYLQLDYSNSEMYEYSKTEKEGFEPHTSSTGNVTYRKHYPKGVFGELLNVGIRESDYGDKLQVSLRHNGDYVHMQFGLYDQKGNIDNRYAESLIRFIPSLAKGVAYRFFPYAISAEDQKKQDEERGNEVRSKYYPMYGVSVKTADLDSEQAIAKVEPALNYSGEGDNVIPKVTWSMNRAKKNIQDPVELAAKNDYLLDKLMEAAEGHLAYEGTNSDTPVEQNAKPSMKIPTATPAEAFEEEEEDNDDLPF